MKRERSAQEEADDFGRLVATNVAFHREEVKVFTILTPEDSPPAKKANVPTSSSPTPKRLTFTGTHDEYAYSNTFFFLNKDNLTN